MALPHVQTERAVVARDGRGRPLVLGEMPRRIHHKARVIPGLVHLCPPLADACGPAAVGGAARGGAGGPMTDVRTQPVDIPQIRTKHGHIDAVCPRGMAHADGR